MAKYFMLHKMASMRDDEENLEIEEDGSEELDEIGHIQIHEDQNTESTSEDSGSLPSNSSQCFNSSGVFSKSTEKCVKFAVSLLKFWCESNGESTDVENMTAKKLDEILGEFYSSVRTKTGTMYSVSSLISFRYSLNRYFQSLNGDQKIDIIESPSFASSNDAYNNIIKSMKLNGDDKNNAKEKNYLTPDDLRLIYTRVFNIESPKTLQFKVWLEVATYFTKCGRQKQRFLTKDSFVFGSDSVGRFVTLKKLPETNAQNLFQNLTREGRKMYEKKDHPMCPVLSLSRYLSKLNVNGNDLFQRPKYKVSHSNDAWYYHQPVGKNYLGNVMSMICKQAGITKHISNKCLKFITPQVLEACIFSIPCSKLFEPTCTIVSLNSPFVHQPSSTQVAENDHDVMLATNSTDPVTTDINSNQIISPSSSNSVFRNFHESQMKQVGSNDITSSGANPTVSFESAKLEIMKLFQSVDVHTSSELKRWIINEDFSKEYRDDGQMEGYRHEYEDRSMYARMMPHSSYPYNPGLMLKPGSYGHNVASRYPLSPLPMKPLPLSHYPGIGAPAQHIQHNPGAAYGYNYHGMYLPPGNMLQSPTSTTHPVPSSSTNYHNPPTTQSTIYDNRSYQPDTTNYNNHSDINMSGDAGLQTNKPTESQGGIYEGPDICTYNKCDTWANETVDSGCPNILECDGKSTPDTNQHRSGKVCEASIKKKLAEKITGRNKRGRHSKRIMKTKFSDKSWDRSIIDEVFASSFSNTTKSNPVLSKNPTVMEFSNSPKSNPALSKNPSATVSTPQKRSIPNSKRTTPLRKKTRRGSVDQVTPEPNSQSVKVRSVSTQANKADIRGLNAKDSPVSSSRERLSKSKDTSSRSTSLPCPKKSENSVSSSRYKSEQAKSYFNYLGLDFKSKSPTDSSSPHSSRSYSSSDRSGEAEQNHLSKSKNHSLLRSRLQLRKAEGKRSKFRYHVRESSRQRLVASPDCTRCDELKQRFGIVPMLRCCHSGKYRKTSDSMKNGSSSKVLEDSSERQPKISSQDKFSIETNAITEGHKLNSEEQLHCRKEFMETKSTTELRSVSSKHPSALPSSEHPSPMSGTQHPSGMQCTKDPSAMKSTKYPSGIQYPKDPSVSCELQSRITTTNHSSVIRRERNEEILHSKSMTTSSLAEPTTKKTRGEQSPSRINKERTLIRKESSNNEPYVKSLHNECPDSPAKYGKRSSRGSSIANQKIPTTVRNPETTNVDITRVAKESIPKLYSKSMSQLGPLKHNTSSKTQIRLLPKGPSDSPQVDSKTSNLQQIQELSSISTSVGQQSCGKNAYLIPNEKAKGMTDKTHLLSYNLNQKENEVISGDKMNNSGMGVIPRTQNQSLEGQDKSVEVVENIQEYKQESTKTKNSQNTLLMKNHCENNIQESHIQNSPDQRIAHKTKHRQKLKTFKKRESDNSIPETENDLNNCVVVNPIYKSLVKPMKPLRKSKKSRKSHNVVPIDKEDDVLCKIKVPPISSNISSSGDGVNQDQKLHSVKKTEKPGNKIEPSKSMIKFTSKSIIDSTISSINNPDNPSETNDSLKASTDSKSPSSLCIDPTALESIQRFLEVNLPDILKNAAQSIGKGGTIATSNSSGIPVNISIGNPKEFNTASHLKSISTNEKPKSSESLNIAISSACNIKAIQSKTSSSSNPEGIGSISKYATKSEGTQFAYREIYTSKGVTDSNVIQGKYNSKGIRFSSSEGANQVGKQSLSNPKGTKLSSGKLGISKRKQSTQREATYPKGVKLTSNENTNLKRVQSMSREATTSKEIQSTSRSSSTSKDIQASSCGISNSKTDSNKEKLTIAGPNAGPNVVKLESHRNVNEDVLPKINQQDKGTLSQTDSKQRPNNTYALNPVQIQKQTSKLGLCNVPGQYTNNTTTNLAKHPLIAKNPLQSANVTQLVSNPTLISPPIVFNTSCRFNPVSIHAWQRMNRNLVNANPTSRSNVSNMIKQAESRINTDSLNINANRQIKRSVSISKPKQILSDNCSKIPRPMSQTSEETQQNIVLSTSHMSKTEKNPINMMKHPYHLNTLDSKTAISQTSFPEVKQNDLLPSVSSRRKSTKISVLCQPQSQTKSTIPIAIQKQPSSLSKEEIIKAQSHKKTTESLRFQSMPGIERTDPVPLQFQSERGTNNPVTHDSSNLRRKCTNNSTNTGTLQNISHVRAPANERPHQQCRIKTTCPEATVTTSVTRNTLTGIKPTEAPQTQIETALQQESQEEDTNPKSIRSQLNASTEKTTSEELGHSVSSEVDKRSSVRTSANAAATKGEDIVSAAGTITEPLSSNGNPSSDLSGAQYTDNCMNNSDEFSEISPRKSKASTNLIENTNEEFMVNEEEEKEDTLPKKQSLAPIPMTTEFVKITGSSSGRNASLSSLESDLNKESCMCVDDMVTKVAAREALEKPGLKEEGDSLRLYVSSEEGSLGSAGCRCTDKVHPSSKSCTLSTFPSSTPQQQSLASMSPTDKICLKNKNLDPVETPDPILGVPDPSFGVADPSVGVPYPSFGVPGPLRVQDPSFGVLNRSFGVPDPPVTDPEPSYSDPNQSIGDPDFPNKASPQTNESMQEKANAICTSIGDDSTYFAISPGTSEHDNGLVSTFGENPIVPFINDDSANMSKQVVNEHESTNKWLNLSENQIPPFLDDDSAKVATKQWITEQEKDTGNLEEVDKVKESHSSTSGSRDHKTKDQKKKKPMLLKVKFSEFKKRLKKKKGHKVTSPSRQPKE